MTDVFLGPLRGLSIAQLGIVSSRPEASVRFFVESGFLEMGTPRASALWIFILRQAT